MFANSSCIILIFELYLYLTTVTSVSYSELEPIAKEVEKAIEEMSLPGNIKDAFSKHYINVGGYSNSVIELLDSYKTFSRSPIHFDDKEKSILTLSRSEDPIESKVRTQLKYYRKMQEVQCTDYFVLYNILNDSTRDMQHIIQHVYNIIKMAYLGKFVVFAWVLKLHINLLTPSDWKHEEWVLHLTREGLHDIEQYKIRLDELVNMCMRHNYLEKNCTVIKSFTTISKLDNFNTQLHNNNESPLPFSVDHLYLGNIRLWQHQIEPITSRRSIHAWNSINDFFQNEISKMDEQLSTEQWKMDPFKNITFQQMLLDIVRVKLYCFFCILIGIYSRPSLTVVDSCFKYELDYYYRIDYLVSMISEKVQVIHMEDETLNEVLKLYGGLKKGKPNCEQCKKMCKILLTEIKKSSNTFKLPRDVLLFDIALEDIEFERTLNLFLSKIEKRFLEFENFLEISLDGMPYNYLLFFVNGSNNTELAVFQ